MEQIAPQFRAIAGRRQAIQAELSTLRSQIEALESELGELEVAARVLQRLGLLAEKSGPEWPLPVPQPASGEDQPRPTMPDMIRAIVAGFVEAGLPGATSQQIVTEVNRRWGVSDPNLIRPTLWRMLKSERLKKSGYVYTLINGIGPPQQSTAAFHPSRAA